LITLLKRESPLLVWNPFVVVVVFIFDKGRLPVCLDHSICSLGSRRGLKDASGQ